MEDTVPLGSLCKDSQEGWFTSRTASGELSPLGSARQRLSLPGHRSADRFHHKRLDTDPLDISTHHTFCSPKVVKASHELYPEVVHSTNSTHKCARRDYILWRNHRLVARNLFLDRVQDAGK